MIEDNNKLNMHKFSLLREDLEVDDLLEDKTHEKLADTIIKIIKNEKSGATIGLEGPWGSGKSNVISLIKKKLNKDIPLFWFDAWAHEGDPLRRIFLESLIGELKKEDNVDCEKLEELQAEISNRKKKTFVRTKNSTTKLGTFLSLSALFVPFGIGLLATVKDLNFGWGLTMHKRFWVGTFFTLLPVFVCFYNALYILKKQFRKMSFKQNFRNMCNLENWSFLESEKNEIVKQEVSEEAEKSSIEFEKYFEDILNEFLKSDFRRKLIIVIDNLDRVNPKDSLKIWSTLQTFLQFKKKQYENIWVLVPYDPEGLSRIWENKDPDGDPDDEGECAKSFFDKCFQLRLDVPKMVMTGWEKFAGQKIREAALCYNEGEEREVLDILRLTRENIDDIPTPREIKSYINQVGVLRLHADSSIPLKSIAYYAAHRYLRKKMFAETIRKELILSELPRDNEKHLLPNTCCEDLAGLVFGVSSSKGQQLLLGPDVNRALMSGSSDEIKAILKKHPRGFWPVFLNRVKNLSPDVITMLSCAKAIYNGLFSEYSKQCASFVEKLKFILNRTDEIAFPTEENIEAYGCLVRILDKDENSEKMLYVKISNSLNAALDKDKNFDYNVNIKLLNRIVNFFKAYSVTYRELDGLKQNQLTAWAKSAFDAQIPAWKWIRPTEQTIKEIPALITAGEPFRPGLKEAIAYSVNAGANSNWKEVIASFRSHIEWNNGTPDGGKIDEDIFEVLLVLGLHFQDCHDDLTAIVKTGQCANFAHHCHSKSKMHASLLYAYCLGQELHTFQMPSLGNSATGFTEIVNFWKTSNLDNAKEVYSCLKEARQWEFLWDLAKDPQNSLVVDIISLAIEDKENKDLFKCDKVLHKIKSFFGFPELKQDLKEGLCKMFIEQSDLEDELLTTENIEVNDFSEELYFIAGTTKNKKLILKLGDKLKMASKEEWIKSFSDDSWLFELALQVKKKNEDFCLENSYLDGLLEFLKQKAGITENQQEQWIAIVSLMGDSFKKYYSQEVTKRLLESSFNVKPNFYEVNVEYFLITDITRDRHDIQNSLKDICEKKDSTRLIRLNDLLNNLTAEKFSPEKHFIDVIRNPLNEWYSEQKDDDTKKIIRDVAQKFKVKLVENQSTKSED